MFFVKSGHAFHVANIAGESVVPEQKDEIQKTVNWESW